MTRLTGTDAWGLMEAYNAVYESQEITEEEIQEDFDFWVNSLVEEGYDLSEYTWNELYDYYIEEQGGSRSSRGPIKPEVQARWRAIGNTLLYGNSGGRTSGASRPAQSGASRPAGSGSRDRGRSTGQNSGVWRPTPSGPGSRRGAAPVSGTASMGASRPAPSGTSRPPIGNLPPSARQVTQYPQGVSTGVGGGNAGASRQTPSGASRPAPAPSGASRPAPALSATQAQDAAWNRQAARARDARFSSSLGGPASIPAQTNVPSTSTTPSPSQQLIDLRKMRMASQMRQAGQNVVSTQLASFDPFDVIMGYLINEGYADTEQDALVIMTNMSEDWKQAIIESNSRDTRTGSSASFGTRVHPDDLRRQ